MNETARTSRNCSSIILCWASVLCLVMGCGEVPPTEPPQPMATTVTVAPSAVTLSALSDTARIAATVLDQNGQVMTGVLVTYSSSASGVATVDGSGLVMAVGNGTAVVTATSGEASGTATVTVEQRVVEVRVSPDSVTLLAIGDTIRLVAGAWDSNGNPVANAEFAWSSADSAVTVDGSGLVAAVASGTAVVTATSGETSGTATVTVEQRVVEVRVSPDSVTLLAIGDTIRLVAGAWDSNGNPVANAEFAWSSTDSAVTVDGSGLVAAVASGTAVVTATSGETSGTATVTVEQRVVEVRVSPDSVTLLAIGDTIRLVAGAWDSNGNPVANAEFAWSSTDSAVTVDGSGLVAAVASGTAVVTATSGETSGTATVTVEQRVVEVRVSPDSVTLLAIGDTIRLVAGAWDSNGNPVANAEFAWSSADSAVTVDGSGLVAAVASGTAVVTATSGETSGTATVTVEQRVVEVRVSPDSATLFAIGDTVRLVAEALDANGQAAVKAEFEWSSDETVATVDTMGLVTAVDEGMAPVMATSGTASGSALVTVRLLTGAARDRAILETLYEATGGSSWSNNDKWLTDAPLDDWYGVGADREGRVVEVKLISNNLTGHLPPELGRLDELRDLRLDAALGYASFCERPFKPPESRTRNRSTGGSPGSDADAQHHYLRSWVRHTVEGRTYGVDQVADAALRTLPRSGTGLQRAGNRLTGHIPPELGNLANLETLSLNLNELSGPIPPELGKLVNLRNLWLAGNQLTGSLPRELGNLTRLERLFLGVSYDYSLNPPRPRHALSGPLPPELGTLVNLTELDLFGHKFTGSIPPEFGRLRRLQDVHLTCNSLTGPLPSELGQLREMLSLGLFGNQLQGQIPASLGELANLRFIDLSSNWYLTGPIPPSLGGLSELVQLYLIDNRHSGPIPSELGRLANLNTLALSYNQFTGALPPQLGDLMNLEHLDVHQNMGLFGPLPRELTETPLWSFKWFGTSLCAPRDRVFQAWLASIPDHLGDQDCTLPPPEVFAAFFEATGGSGWSSNANWLTDAPVSSWFGVTVEDSLVTALELAGNGLSGTLPPAVGDFLDLRRLELAHNALRSGLPEDLGDLPQLEVLDLSSNRFSGAVPHELGRLDALERLHLSDNTLEGALPGDLTNLRSLSSFDWRDSGACAPEVAWFQRWLGSVATRAGPACDGLFSLSIADAHLSQASQSPDGAVPLIAGRPALARVFATADRANDFTPNTRAAFLLDGQEFHAVEMTLGSSRGLAEHLPGRLDQWYHSVIPAVALRPGVEMALQLDPDSIVPRSALDPMRLFLDVREMPRLELTIVPVVTGSSEDADVLDWIQSADDPPVEFMRAVLPVGEIDLTIRDPLSIAAAPDGSDGRDWIAILNDIELLSATEGGSGYWYGVVNRVGDQGIRGVAKVEGRASLGVPDAEVFAHEVGHNMSLNHAPCGNPARLDPDYPYPAGNIGVLGYDPRSGELVDPSTADLMSYCHPQWISDYNFKKALRYRLERETGTRALAAQDHSRGQRLLLWGHVTAKGELHFDPAFALDAPAKLPSGSGPYRVEGVSRDGTRVFALNFGMEQVSDSEGGRSFLFLIPFTEERIASLARIVLSGPEGSTALGRETRGSPVAIVMDRATGRIRAILRGEAAEAANATVAADARTEAVPRERVLVSYGLPELEPL